MKLANRVAIVTGGANGIGRAISLRLAEEGTDVVVADMEIVPSNKVVNEIRALGKKAIATETDVSKSEEVNLLAKTTLDEFGRIDILVNNAGVSTMSPVISLTEEDWDVIMDVNAKGVFLVSQAVLPHMIAAGSGKIVNIGSGAPKRGGVYLAHYAASKGAVLAFTRCLAKEVAEYHINVNSVCPGFIQTSMQDREVVWEGELLEMAPEAVRQSYVDRTPLGRLGQPEDVAGVVLFLASPDADFMTGQTVNVSGGVLLH